MKKSVLIVAAVSIILLNACTFSEDNTEKIEIDDLYSFLITQQYQFASYNHSSEQYSSTIYYIGEKGLDRELLESEKQVSSQRAASFTLSDGSTAYVLIGEILSDISVPQDVVIEFTQTIEEDTKEPYVCNTVYIFKNIVISYISNHYGEVVDEAVSVEFNYELSSYIKQYLGQNK